MRKVRLVPDLANAEEGLCGREWQGLCTGGERGPCSSLLLAQFPHLATLTTSHPTCSSNCCPTCSSRTVILDNVTSVSFADLKFTMEAGHSSFLSEERAEGVREVARMMGVSWREVEEELAKVSSGEVQVATNIVTMSTIIVTSIVTNPPTSSP